MLPSTGRGVRAAGITSGTAGEKQPHRYAREPGNSQVTPATEERGWGFPPDPLDTGAQAVENMPRLECARGALLLPMLSTYFPEMHREMQGIRDQQSDRTIPPEKME